MMSSVAVLGGGISGLSAAYYLARLAPTTTKITLIEGKDRIGGWIQSRRVGPGIHTSQDTLPPLSNQKDSVLFEGGPRTLRPKGAGGAILLEMIQHLDLANQDLLLVPNTHPSAKNRYIYYKDQINTLPASLSSVLFNKPPVLKSVPLAGLLEPFRSSRFKQGMPRDGQEDESIYDFMNRRFNTHAALHLMGAMTHGIYAGDVKQLSLKSTFRLLYEAEKEYGSVIKGLIKGVNTETMRERGMAVRARDTDPAWFSRLEKMNVVGFRDGLASLSDRLLDWLRARPNVEIIMQEPVQSMETLDGKEVKIKTKTKELYADHVIATLPSFDLQKLISSRPLPHLDHNPAADVAVVNLAYQPNVKLGYDGFGFLTPHRDTPYPVPVPGTLGVIFDSNALSDQERDYQPNVHKFTAMIGGSDWKDAFRVPIDQLDPHIAYDTARNIMSEFLNIKDTPTHAMVHLQKQCIPQYLVGHESRMRELHHALASQYGSLMSVAGASYLGVSVPDCIKHSRMLVEELLVAGALGTRNKVVTGLGKTVQNTQELKDGARLNRGNINVIMKA
ncbi:protoporphyrinogen oxidase [Gilbertella persicaria]|uniref:protoporphyrinogen oxidase n=1 Tax=Gilbertella persicaria TaxID=101096 RepID=UPI00221ED60F|nr:protoporphyrinogen oxidase [Gilbertella persicaria]KAI8073495.1 protoporphyrinogen oxidase [Gilbertella persicaria]